MANQRLVGQDLIAHGSRAVAPRTRLLLAALQATSAAAGTIPRREVAEPLCRLVGTVWFLTAPAARAAVRDNLRHVLGREPTRREAMPVFQHGVLNYWDTFAIPHLSRDQLLDLVDMQGLEELDAARAAGRGAIVASAHLGSVALVGQVLPVFGYPTSGIVEPIQPPEVFEFFLHLRQAFGVRLLPSGAAALREMLQVLRRNEVIGLVTDRDVAGSGPSVPFFDAPARFPDGAAALSVRTGAPVLIAAAVRRPDGRFVARIEAPLAVPGTGQTKEDVLQLTRAIAGRLQYHIASHPEQWTVFQKRWPERQPG